jgi:hypothetical protein
MIGISLSSKNQNAGSPEGLPRSHKYYPDFKRLVLTGLNIRETGLAPPPPRPFDRLRTVSPIKGEEIFGNSSDFPSLGGRGKGRGKPFVS